MLSPARFTAANFENKKAMKAAVIYKVTPTPQYTDVPTPQPTNSGQLLVSVKAVAIKNLDRSRAAGKHYSTEQLTEEGRIIGGDGVCMLEDGTRVYALGVTGMMAEKAIIERDRMVAIPNDLDDATAAALPNAVFGAAMALKFKAEIKPGDVVLINGATGFTGHIAVQIAKIYGASKVIATGRNHEALDELFDVGADEMISLSQDDEQIKAMIKAVHANTPIDIVIDYIWGHPAELILNCLKGDGSFTHQTKYVSVGSMAGDNIQLSAAILRSTNLQIIGSGLGSWTNQQVDILLNEILPQMFALAADGKIKVNTITVPIESIADLWNLDVPGGRRLVVTIQ